MWVSQTYLGNIGQEADVYIYYFWEDYAEQSKVDDSVLKHLAELGYSFREKVSVFVPQSGYFGLIREEMRTKFDKFWRTFSGKTPGLFFITKPLSDFDPVSGDWLFLPIPSRLVADNALLTNFFESSTASVRKLFRLTRGNLRQHLTSPQLLWFYRICMKHCS